MIAVCWRTLSAGGCVLLWLVPWTAFVAEARCTCTYRWRGRRGGSTREKRVGWRGGVRLGQTVCVCRKQLLSFISLCTGPIFSFLFSLTLSPRRHTDLSSWCKRSVNKTLRHWWYRAAPRWVKACECADYTLLLPADLKNAFVQAERPKTWMKNSRSIKKSCCTTTQRWPWRTINKGNETNPEYMQMIHHLCAQFLFYPWQKIAIQQGYPKD